MGVFYFSASRRVLSGTHVKWAGHLNKTMKEPINKAKHYLLSEEIGKTLYLDVSGIEEIDSTCLGDLIAFNAVLKSKGIHLILLEPSLPILKKIEEAGLGELFEIQEKDKAA